MSTMPADVTASSQITWRSLMTGERWVELGRIVFVGGLTFLYWRQLLPIWALFATIAIGLYPLAKTGLFELIREKKIGTEVFVTIATVIAMIGKEYVAGAVLMTIILIAEFIADLNTDRARASIKALIGSVPQSATVRLNDQEVTVPIVELKVGDIVLVRAGEKVPVDGVVVSGEGAVNESPITGESMPQEKAVGSSVLAGTIAESGALDIRTEKIGEDTMFSLIIALVEQAEEEQAKVQKLADKVASWLIPVVLVFLLGVYLVTHDLRKVVTLLIFTSPAELGLATPLVMIAAVARAARHGILVKGGIYLELLAKATVVVFDKTGTLTEGQPSVAAVEATDRSLDNKLLLQLAASADRRSAHPLAKAVVERARQEGLNLWEPSHFEMIRGRGVSATVEGKRVLVGNETLLHENQVSVVRGTSDFMGTTVYVAVNGVFCGRIQIVDQIRPGAKAALSRLKALGVKRSVMLTGDSTRTALQVGAELGIDDIRGDLLPEDKVKAVADLKKNGEVVVMVGDGVNDAPALATADVGIAMGARGTQAAIEAADVALMTDDLSKISLARSLARRAYRTIQENLFVGVGVVHVLGITAALLGWIGPIQAALLHLSPDILVFVNSVKLVRVKLEE